MAEPSDIRQLADSAEVVVFHSPVTDLAGLDALLERSGRDWRMIEMGMGSAESRGQFATLKAQTGWSTLPQVFVHGRFVGGLRAAEAKLQPANRYPAAAAWMGYLGLLPFLSPVWGCGWPHLASGLVACLWRGDIGLRWRHSLGAGNERRSSAGRAVLCLSLACARGLDRVINAALDGPACADCRFYRVAGLGASCRAGGVAELVSAPALGANRRCGVGPECGVDWVIAFYRYGVKSQAKASRILGSRGRASSSLRVTRRASLRAVSICSAMRSPNSAS
jgi:hypothetical protein